MQNKKKHSTSITSNKKAYFDYEIIDNWEAGISLKWYEVKSLRQGLVNLKWSYITCNNDDLYIKSMHISIWKSLPNKSSLDPSLDRKIFLHRKTINLLLGKLKEPWYSVVPLELYFKWSLIKVRVWLVKWKKLYQKKQILKERDMDKRAKVMMKNFNG